MKLNNIDIVFISIQYVDVNIYILILCIYLQCIGLQENSKLERPLISQSTLPEPETGPVLVGDPPICLQSTNLKVAS